MTCGCAKQFSARRTFHPPKINPLHLGGCNDLPTFRTYRIERYQHFFEIDLPRAWHDPTILIRDRNGAELQCGPCRSGVDFKSPFTHLSAVPCAPGLLCDPMISFRRLLNAKRLAIQAATLRYLQ